MGEGGRKGGREKGREGEGREGANHTKFVTRLIVGKL